MNARSSHVRIIAKLCAGTAVALAALTVAPNAREPAPVVLASVMQDQCDRMAGSPYDQNRNTAYAPVGIEEIDTEAVTACRIAFEATHNPRFAYQLGRALNRTQEADQAMTAYETAVNADYSAAKVNFGMLMGRMGDTSTEFKMYSEAAATGNVLAAYNLGVAYRDGLGTDKNGEKALSWFEKAAAGGDSTAAFNIGAMYDEGDLVAEDNQLAIAWYDIAAKRGNADAMINLGLMYQAGEGIAANPQAAAEMYAEAAAAGDSFGALKLKEMQDAGVVPAPAPDVATTDHTPKGGIDMLVLQEGDVEIPSTLLSI
ncbi:TPR repeat protein [Neorhizobium galegae]|uniref:tetratricopeptide repeat protein n=1 Tax=Neorhizobium galegae TaxID=399 RepID=UPI001AEB3A38|nr:tetratricopeptide repeat protein [Neorhizobium galegae]MBP2548183.1 TPR repeat protein [Neorhizobium galegae]